MAKKSHGSRPTPISPQLDGKRASTGGEYPDNYFTNPWNAGIDSQLNMDGDTKTLRSPTSTPAGMDVLTLHEGTYNKLWEEGK